MAAPPAPAPAQRCDLVGAPAACGVLTRLAHGELHGAPRVEQLLHQRLGQHGGCEEHGPAALAAEVAHQAVGYQAEALAELALGVQLWEGQERAGCHAPTREARGGGRQASSVSQTPSLVTSEGAEL